MSRGTSIGTLESQGGPSLDSNLRVDEKQILTSSASLVSPIYGRESLNQ